MFNKWQAQRWWAENYDRVMELYNVQRFNRQAFPLPTPPRSEDEVSFFTESHVQMHGPAPLMMHQCIQVNVHGIFPFVPFTC